MAAKTELENGHPVAWACPWCGKWFDTRTENIYEEYTVGGFPGDLPHVRCPECGLCMGCSFKG